MTTKTARPRVMRSEVRDARGRVWKIARVPERLLAAEDARFWRDELTPEERVDAVDACVVGWFEVRGKRGAPRLRRVSRRVQRAQR